MNIKQEIIDELNTINNRRTELYRQLHEVNEAEEKSRQGVQGINACGKSWRDDGTCAYCGSMKIERAIELLKTTGTRYSGADWKYGWPHKFYIGDRKFYNKHIKDATPDQVVEFSRLSAELFDIEWTYDSDPERGVGYRAVSGIQNYGVVGGKVKEVGEGLTK